MAGLTAEEFEARGSQLEDLVDGRVVSLTPTSLGHGKMASRFDWALREQVKRTGAGEVVTAETGFITRRNPDRVRAPDVAFVAAARLVGRETDRFFEGSPDLAVEILSPSDRPADVREKIEEYLAAGTRLVWVGDPAAATVTVHRLSGPPVVLRTGDTLDGEDVLPGLRIPVASVIG